MLLSETGILQNPPFGKEVPGIADSSLPGRGKPESQEQGRRGVAGGFRQRALRARKGAYRCADRIALIGCGES